MALAGFVLTLLVSFYAVRQIKQSKEELLGMMPSLDDYVFQDEEGTWQLDQRLGKMFDHVGSRMALSIRQSLFQGQGVQAKIEKGAYGALVDDVFDSGVLGQIGGLADMFSGGRFRDYCKKNPSAIRTIIPLLSGGLQGGQGLNLKALMGNRQSSASSTDQGKRVFDLG